jgi:hypothetical protein
MRRGAGLPGWMPTIPCRGRAAKRSSMPPSARFLTSSAFRGLPGRFHWRVHKPQIRCHAVYSLRVGSECQSHEPYCRAPGIESDGSIVSGKNQADKPFAEQLVRAIDSVHGVQGIISVPIERKPLAPGWNGQFDPYTRTITVSPNAALPLATGAHEIGHALDALFLVSASNLGRLDGPISLYASQYAVQGRGSLVNWYEYVKQSRPFIELIQGLSRERFMSDAWNDARYWSDPRELWARAYEQFVAENTDATELKDQFRRKRLDEAFIGNRKIRVYWTQEGFQTISNAIRHLLKSLGWM